MSLCVIPIILLPKKMVLGGCAHIVEH